MTHTIQMVELICFDCGVPFFVPQIFWKAVLNSDRSLHCPNGHEIAWASDQDCEDKKTLNAKNTKLVADHAAALQEVADLKGRMVELRHRCEQLEGKGDGDAIAAATADVGAGAGGDDGDTDDDALPTLKRSSRGWQCPYCEQVFKLLGARLESHVRRAHGKPNFDTNECPVDTKVVAE